MKAMIDMADNEFDLAIVDPPYGIGITKQNLGAGSYLHGGHKSYKTGEWDKKPPSIEYFNELFRVSKQQIIWGGNYFGLRGTPCYIFWDKNNGANDFADGELAWTSFKSPVRRFKYTWSGYVQEAMGRNKEKRIHPTQKPIGLYKWLLGRYAKDDDRILDTHFGSGSIAIACWDLKFDLVGYELDADYYKGALNRFNSHCKQRQFLFGSD